MPKTPPSHLRNPAHLRPHPLFEKTHHPMMSRDSAQWAALVENIRERGVLQPVIITGEDLIVDGRHRAAAAVEAGLNAVRVEVVDEAQAPIIIAETLAHRRHFSKAARAFLLAPFAEECAEAGKKEKNANLRQNSRNDDSNDIREEGVPLTLESFADRMGISRDYLAKGRDVYHRLEKLGGRKTAHPETGAALTVRERVEQMLFEEGCGFQQVLAMLGYLAAGNKPNGERLKNARAEYGRLAREKLEKLTDNFRGWERTDAVEKQMVYDALPKVIPAWPLDVCQRLYTELAKRRDEWTGKGN